MSVIVHAVAVNDGYFIAPRGFANYYKKENKVFHTRGRYDRVHLCDSALFFFFVRR